MHTLYLTNTRCNSNKQQGVVLIVALVFLVALTAVAGALMQNTTTDIKMAGATQEKAIVTQETISEMEHIIFNELREVNGPNQLAQIITGEITFPVTNEPTLTQATGVNANQYGFDVPCPRSNNATSEGTLMCSIKRLQVTRTYGRDNNHTIQVNSGVAQVIMTTTGN